MRLADTKALIFMRVMVSIGPVSAWIRQALLAGAMPRRQLNLILAWAELHQQELLDNWNRVALEQPLNVIDGLR
jgi:hypothetical protein